MPFRYQNRLRRIFLSASASSTASGVLCGPISGHFGRDHGRTFQRQKARTYRQERRRAEIVAGVGYLALVGALENLPRTDSPKLAWVSKEVAQFLRCRPAKVAAEVPRSAAQATTDLTL